MKFVALRAYTVIAIDESTGVAIREAIPLAKVKIVPNCVDFSKLPIVSDPDGESNRTVLFVGWVVPTKGISELLQAWATAKSTGWRLRIAGPGDPKYINSLVCEYVDLDVDFLGELSHRDAMIEMSKCDVFVLPSYTEGFPNAVLEAMALGKTVIASTVGAIPEMLNNGECGILVAPKDVNGLAECIKRVINDKHLRKSLGVQARSRALDYFSIDTVFNSYLSIWNSASGGVRSL